MSNEQNNRFRTDYMGIAAIIFAVFLWQLLTIIQVLLIIAGVAAIIFGCYWLWAKVQAGKNHQNFMNNMYNNHNSAFNQPPNNFQNQIPSSYSNQLPPKSYQTPNEVFDDFAEYQRFKEWQRQKGQQINNQTNTNQRPPYNPYSENYEG